MSMTIVLINIDPGEKEMNAVFIIIVFFNYLLEELHLGFRNLVVGPLVVV